MNLILEVNNDVEFYTNGEDWLVKVISNVGNDNVGHKTVYNYYELLTTHNYRFNESMLVETTPDRFQKLISFSTFKKIDVNNRIDWAKMEVPQEKINKEE